MKLKFSNTSIGSEKVCKWIAAEFKLTIFTDPRKTKFVTESSKRNDTPKRKSKEK